MTKAEAAWLEDVRGNRCKGAPHTCHKADPMDVLYPNNSADPADFISPRVEIYVWSHLLAYRINI